MGGAVCSAAHNYICTSAKFAHFMCGWGWLQARTDVLMRRWQQHSRVRVCDLSFRRGAYVAMAGLLRSLRSVSPRAIMHVAGTTGGCISRCASSQPNNKIYELLRYKTKPGKFTQFLSLLADKYPTLMMPHGKLLGYWAVSLGSINEAFHLWEFGEGCTHSPVLY